MKLAIRLKHMPTGLRWLTLGLLASPLHLPYSFLALHEHCTQQVGIWSLEFRGHAGLTVGLLIVYSEVLAYGFISARWWSRLLYFAPILVSVTPVWSCRGSAMDQVILCSWTIVAVWYLFLCRSVRDYF
ncbi:MAG: hypothetical protein U1G07_17135 [Verrucomicrobiota bacterium]